MKEHNKLTSIVCKNNINYNMIYLIHYIVFIAFLLPFDYSYNQKSINNLKDKSVLLIKNENFHLALNIYLKILDFEKNIYSDDSIELAQTYDQIANLYIQIGDDLKALSYIKKSIAIYEKKY